jgi:hypothetical protein
MILHLIDDRAAQARRCFQGYPQIAEDATDAERARVLGSFCCDANGDAARLDCRRPADGRGVLSEAVSRSAISR